MRSKVREIRVKIKAEGYISHKEEKITEIFKLNQTAFVILSLPESLVKGQKLTEVQMPFQATVSLYASQTYQTLLSHLSVISSLTFSVLLPHSLAF